MSGALAAATAVVHFIALGYIGLGGFLAWRWPRTIYVHVFFAAWGVLVNVTPIPCPLTELENHFRHQQGLGDLPGGFNEHYIYGELFPHAMLPVVGVLAIVLLVVSYAGVWARRRRGVKV
ncbi:DUF2784 domain-containing protein [Actinokineospora sp. NPDC004072]